MSATLARQKWRLLKDKAAAHGIAIGGISVIFAILVIFIYLLYVVVPLFKPASMEEVAHYPVPGGQARTLYIDMEEQTEIGTRVSADGQVTFFATHDGSVILQQQLKLPRGSKVVSFSAGDPARATFAFGLDNGQALVVKAAQRVSYPNDVRVITPYLEYPLGEAPIQIDLQRKPLTYLGFQLGSDGAAFASANEAGRLTFISMEKKESMFDDEVSYSFTRVPLEVSIPVRTLLIDKDLQELYVLGQKGGLSFFSIRDHAAPELVQHLPNLGTAGAITDIRFLSGGTSLLVATDQGRVYQWFPVRDAEGQSQLTRIRSFEAHRGAITRLSTEYHRKGFITADDQGNVGIFHATAHNTVLVEKVADSPVTEMAVAPRANALLAEDAAGSMHFLRIENDHPEVSWSALWGKVWYEGYTEPAYTWQSTSGNNDFEPKLSLVPLSFGTLKAAFYAMLIAVPLAIFGAIYTAQFMTPRMRSKVKPSIEIMEALPTVIIGFLAGLWLAPFVEEHLAGMFSLLLLLPFGVLLAAYGWSHWLPERMRVSVPDGWEAALLVPGVLIVGYLAFSTGALLEHLFFGGDLIRWFANTLDIPYDQRNAVIVGFAMGFAVIPTIFSIAEDAIFAVPKHLINGSLALGATPWQTLVRVVLLTASPGIFSAVMIGLGRAVGETMIVLMATGNTPVMDLSMFQGMRTLSANIAVEMPESEVDSSHYRILFLAALVLFAFTFIFNTLAEVIRQRLRRKYSSL